MKIPIVHFDDVGDGEPPNPISNDPESPTCVEVQKLRLAQQQWGARSIRVRLGVIRSIRHALAGSPAQLVRAMNPRDEAHAAEMLSSQVIPLADACQFLERQARQLLRPRRVKGQAPLWLAGIRAERHREACGVVLVIAPSNYPLFLPGVILIQALTAGNAVILKPGPGGRAVAEALLALAYAAGVPPDLTLLLSEETGSAQSAITAGVDKIVFTGSATSGREILRAAAERLVPAIVELSGSDAMFVRQDADITLAARALLFGLRINRGSTCIAPRRVFVHESRAAAFEAECIRLFERETWPAEAASKRLAPLIVEAAAQGARVIVGEVDHHGSVTAPVLVANANPSMRLLTEDHFGSAAAIVSVAGDEEALTLNDACPFALGASVFSSNAADARTFAGRVNAGSVVINDVIVPTADPRVSFGGRKHSGFGLTRGAEGLLELTAPKTVFTRRGRRRPHFEAPRPEQAAFFAQFLSFTHAPNWGQRFKAALAFFQLARIRKQT